jgi:hypothetical protein
MNPVSALLRLVHRDAERHHQAAEFIRAVFTAEPEPFAQCEKERGQR